MKKKVRAILASTVCLLLAGQASATIYHITYSGTVTYADDQTGEFGSSAALIGMPFKAFVTFDNAKPGATHSGSAVQDIYEGDGASSPITAKVLLNGVSRSIGSTHGSDFRYDDNLPGVCSGSCSPSGFQQFTQEKFATGALFTDNQFLSSAIDQDGTVSGLAHTGLTFTDPPLYITATVMLFQQNGRTQDVLHSAVVTARIDSVSTAVPEPGTWALMLGGFGLTGDMLRRRRRATSVSFA